MAFFNSHSYKIGISATQAHIYLKRFMVNDKNRYTTKHGPYLFKGWVKKNSFEIQSTLFSEIIAVKGEIEPLDRDHAYIHLNGRLMWLPLILNAGVFISTTFALLIISAMMLQENRLYGFTGLMTSLFMSTKLYQYLIGRIKKNYDKISLEIIGLLACVNETSKKL